MTTKLHVIHDPAGIVITDRLIEKLKDRGCNVLTLVVDENVEPPELFEALTDALGTMMLGNAAGPKSVDKEPGR